MIRTPPQHQTDPAKLPGQIVHPVPYHVQEFTNNRGDVIARQMPAGSPMMPRWKDTHRHTAHCPSSCFRNWSATDGT